MMVVVVVGVLHPLAASRAVGLEAVHSSPLTRHTAHLACPLTSTDRELTTCLHRSEIVPGGTRRVGTPR